MFKLLVGIYILKLVEYASSKECLPSFGSIVCTCNDNSVMCNGIQNEMLDVQQIVSNISLLQSSDHLTSLVIEIENITLDSNFSFENIKIENLTFGSGLTIMPDDLFSSISSSLLSLNLQNNAFSDVPSYALDQLSNLKHLILSNNDITKFKTGDFSGLKDLSVLEVNSNKLDQIVSNAFSSLSSLKELFMNQNQLKELNSSNFDNLLNLELLSVAGNKLNSLDPLIIKKLPGIQTLILDNNEFVSFSELMIESSTLVNLSARNCLIQEALRNDSLHSLPELNHIDFSFNRITEIQPFALSDLKKLQFLNLSNNNIKFLHSDAFSGLYNLIDLNLKNNMISVVKTTSFFNLTKLKSLDLGNNNLEALLCDYTSDLLSLERINIQNNSIKMVNTGSFMYSHNLKELKIGYNALDCTCPLADFVSLLQNRSSLEDVDSIKCSSPHAVYGTPVMEINFQSMNCHSTSPCESAALMESETEDYDDDDLTTESSTITNPSTTYDIVTYANTMHSVLTDESTSHAFITDNTPTNGFTSQTSIPTSTLVNKQSPILTTLFSTTFETETENTNSSLTHFTTVPNNYIEFKDFDDDSISENSSITLVPTTTNVRSSDETTPATTSQTSTYSTFPSTVTSEFSNSTQDLTTQPYSTTNQLLTTSVFESNIYLKNFSLSNKIFCIEWSVDTDLQGKSFRCFMKYSYEMGTVSTYIKCPPVKDNLHKECKTIKAINSIYELCIKVEDYTTKRRLASYCITPDSIPPTNSDIATDQSFLYSAIPNEIDKSTSTLSDHTEKIVTSNSDSTVKELDETSQSFSTITFNSTHSDSEIKSTPTYTFRTTEINTSIKTSKPVLISNTTINSVLLTTSPGKNFNLTKFEVYWSNISSAVVIWKLNKQEPFFACHLTLTWSTDTFNKTEGTFDCKNNTYLVRNLEKTELYRMCLNIYHITHGVITTCSHLSQSSYEFSSSKSSSTGLQTFPFVVLVGLLIMVILLIIVVVLRSFYRKRLTSDRYDISVEERAAQRKMSWGRDQTVRYSYTANQNVEL